jgi:phosphate transport system substrate-binding protein
MLKTLVAALALALAATAAGAVDLSGAGATFPAPVYAKWAETYRGQTGVGLNYQAIGSGGGVRQIKAKTVAFGASDKPLTAAELNQAGLVQFPTVIGGVAPVANLPGLPANRLRLSGAVLADIYLGAVKRWGDPRIAALNPGLKLPNLPITVVHRADGSGTSYLFTTYLALKNPTWAKQVGGADAVEWPTGIGGKGNDGVAAFVKQTPGAIGYVEYAFAKQNRLPTVVLQNKAGAFVAPVSASFSAAAASADWSKAPGYYLLLLDQPGAGAWPITGATFVLMHKEQANAAQGQAVLKFFDWAYKTGDAQAAQLDYVPLPAAVKALVRKTWAGAIRSGGKPVYAGG